MGEGGFCEMMCRARGSATIRWLAVYGCALPGGAQDVKNFRLPLENAAV